MYVVIFTATINELDQEYENTAVRLRDLAIKEYGCTEFQSFCEGDTELALSYWPSMEHIQAWRLNEEHLKAQAMGKSKWYKSYQIKIAELIK